ncbi:MULTISPECIES: single-stranded DNA-binding protein [Arcobacteraceae]|uniref:Single-stranded DNA-binding protein n=1 Tax=Aliarcobacter skirrowii CCUG 10374 TaxID=1032239 RepID=A0AAD0SN08_9BACT|nr:MULTISPECIES: single-stranded DNA-binding protein [Arcobacteraceae]AXX85113.1 single-stranded DNA-binding protein [Aliarcobacter skirrowii CCUG 10374]MDY0179814.1 single-stranded DNA-binding protein [Aliarcobacter skirrowii]SUU96361.1 Helix-destabilizing protein [Aliarcobacter skirrowii]
MNKIILIGNLTRDLELKYSKDGLAIANSSLAINEFRGTEKEKTIFIDISFFGKTAENANRYLHKGSRIAIVGKLDFQSWVAQDGTNKNKHSIIVEDVTYLDKKESIDEGENNE